MWERRPIYKGFLKDCERWRRTANKLCGGEGGIRTPDTVARMPHFECGAIDHSATSPSLENKAFFWRLNPEHNGSATNLLPTTSAIAGASEWQLRARRSRARQPEPAFLA